MSYTLLKRVTPEGVVESTDWRIHNAHGWSAFIYTALTGEYLDAPSPQAWVFDDSVSERLWGLVNDDRLEPFERVVLALTFDLVWVREDDVRSIPEHLRRFHEKHSATAPNAICHLTEIARVIEAEWPRGHGLAFYGMSVSPDQWRVREDCPTCGGELEDDSDFDMNKNKGAESLDVDALVACSPGTKFIVTNES